ncbi:MAG TPA: CapA family protein [Acidimicrobiales bacterium]|nr:CapA family protein [Acidimicrobiales bacterium]HMS88216.1 CapA family protein [Acidimicrobiales bacterium]HRA34807.1 CapA family protein [Acidimicrobiales bacterium]
MPDPVTLAFSGDVLLHMPVNDRAAAYGATTGTPFDFRPMFDPLRPVLEPADLALCHLEVPVAPDGRLTSYPSFGAPAQVVDGIAHGGFDGCSTASNHSLDRGYRGVARTLEELDRARLRHAGTARGPWETGPGLYRVGEPGAEIDVAHLSYAYGFNGYRLPADAPWAASAIDPARIRADAAAARAAGAELVVVSLHWGTEYRHEPDAYQRSIADRILPDSEIDLVIGHHAHVVQPIEVVHGRYVVWGLGNQLSNQTQAPRRDGLTVVVTAGLGWDSRWHVSGVEAVPTWVDLATFRILPVARTLADPATPPALRSALQASHERTASIVQSGGAWGVTVTPVP